MTRTDDIINVAGHRLSTGGMEEVLSSIPDVAECAVIGVPTSSRARCRCGLVVLKAGVSSGVRRDRARSCRWCATASARSPPSSWSLVVKRLPKTRSGKILRGTMQKIADAQDWSDAGDDR
jgi:propionyl-CoA synthetase